MNNPGKMGLCHPHELRQILITGGRVSLSMLDDEVLDDISVA
jgi:hypothetical protein